MFFDQPSQVQMYSSGRNSSHLTFRSCQRWTLLEESLASGMAVLELTIPTGYWIQQQDLEAYVRSKVNPRLKEARYKERQVAFYFDYVSCMDGLWIVFDLITFDL